MYFYAIIMKKTTMWKENLYQPTEILLREHDEFPIGEHQHSFFEMAYILEGTGTFEAHLSGTGKESYAYKADDLFLISPNRTHLFTIHTHSQYLFIRFTTNYVSDYLNRYLGNALDITSHFRLSPDTGDSEALRKLMRLIVMELSGKRRLSGLLLSYYVNSIILLAARSLPESLPEHDPTDGDKAHYMLQYIQQHIHQPELLKLEALAEKFHLSPTYAGRFFKRNFGEDYRKYVSMNRLRKVEEMLVHTHMSIKEIANRMDYIDSCYLNKLFHQHHGITPIQYRKLHGHTSP